MVVPVPLPGPIPFELVNDGDLLLLINRMLDLVVRIRFGFLRFRVMLMRIWYSMVKFVRMIGWVIMLLMKLRTLVVGELVMLSLMLGRTKVCGRWYPVILEPSSFFSLLLLVLWLIMMVGMVLLLILWYGLLVHIPRGVVWFMRFGTRAFLPGPPGIWDSEWVNFLHLPFVLRTLLFGPKTHGLLVKWVSFFE